VRCARGGDLKLYAVKSSSKVNAQVRAPRNSPRSFLMSGHGKTSGLTRVNATIVIIVLGKS
jgi:hypothetical protein